MELTELLNSKVIKSKAKTETISKWLKDNKISCDEIISIAQNAKDPIKATCIEGIEFATKQTPSVANEKCLKFVSTALAEKAPRVKWESAKVIGNIAHLFPAKLNVAIDNLLTNSEHEGTVVRWSSAFALGEIVKLNTKLNKELFPAIEAICEREEKNSIKKIYLAALKNSKK